jgi:hypothetical protein
MTESKEYLKNFPEIEGMVEDGNPTAQYLMVKIWNGGWFNCRRDEEKASSGWR